MSRQTWQRPLGEGGREATRAQIVEAIDRTAPETKSELARAVGISEQYLSELIQDLKADGIVTKSYVVDDAALYDNARSVSMFREDTAGSAADISGEEHRGVQVLGLLDRLESVTSRQYTAAHSAFLGEEVDQPADTLESLANERCSTLMSELKSYTLTTDWPGNRVAADVSTIAMNLEIVGDRACFIADVVNTESTDASGIVGERIDDIFESGAIINSHFCDILFESDLKMYPELHKEEESVHRNLDELFELVTAYDPDMYGYLVTVTRALERAIYYWVDAAELAVQLHSGVRPEHLEM